MARGGITTFVVQDTPPILSIVGRDNLDDFVKKYPVFLEVDDEVVEPYTPIIFSIKEGVLSKVYRASTRLSDKLRGGVLSKLLLKTAVDKGLPGMREKVEIELARVDREYLLRFVRPIKLDAAEIMGLLEDSWRMLVGRRDVSRTITILLGRYSFNPEEILDHHIFQGAVLVRGGSRLELGRDAIIGEASPPYLDLSTLRLVLGGSSPSMV